MREISFEQFGNAVAELMDPAQVPGIGPSEPHSKIKNFHKTSLQDQLFESNESFSESNSDYVKAVLAGVFLLWDDLDQSHQISQRLKTVEGCYWHGIMHRREPDPSNAKYWFRGVGRHPIYEELAQDALEMIDHHQVVLSDEFSLTNLWEPDVFVDLCYDRHTNDETGRQPMTQFVMQLQRREIDLLLEYCFTMLK